jgi:hypothetical protein
MSVRRIVLAAALPLALTACEGVKQELGLTKQPPDEFAVVASKAPLVVPPDFTLRPPRPGAPRPQEQQPAEAARSALVASTQPDSRGRMLTAQPGAPQPGAPSPPPQFANVAPTAGPVVFGASRAATAMPAGPTAGEKALLGHAGTEVANPSIREIVNRESAQLAEADRSFADKLIFWQEPTPPGVVVDAEAEAKRLRENAAVGRDASEGDTPVVVRRKRGWLEGIF